MILFTLSYVNFNMSHSEIYKFKRGYKDGKDFPLRASLKAFEQFKAQRAQKRQESQNPNATNPFWADIQGFNDKMDVLNHKLP